MGANELGDSQNTPRIPTEQEGDRVQLKTWVDLETASEITTALRDYFGTENVSESVRLVLKGFARLQPMRDALHAGMGTVVRAQER